MTPKVLIVGKGVAGTLMAFRCYQNNIPFHIIDKDSGKTSSAVASGLINPVVVKHFGLTWLAKDLLPEAELFYQYIESVVGEKFFHKLEILRVFHQQSEFQLWNKRRKEEQAEEFMEEAYVNTSTNINAPYGFGKIKNAAWVDVEKFIEATSHFFETKNLITKEKYEYSATQIENDTIIYRGETYSHLIFCQGIHSSENPFFDKKPVNPLKGQLVKINSPQLKSEKALSKKIFVLPTGNNFYKVGATYERTHLAGNTSEGIDFLKQKFSDLVDAEFNIVEQYYGFRPTVPDRRPLLGSSNQDDKIFIFNGLGSKGYMLAPYLSAHLYQHIFSKIELMKEVDVRRY